MVLFRDGEGPSREPWHGYFFIYLTYLAILAVLESGFIYVDRFRKTSVTISSQLLQSGIYSISSTWRRAKPKTLWRQFIYSGSILFHRHGKGLSRGPYHDDFSSFLELRLCLVNQFGKNLYVCAYFPHEISFWSLFLIHMHVKEFSFHRIDTKIQFYLVWYLWWLRHGAIGSFEATLFRVNFVNDWLDYRIHTF